MAKVEYWRWKYRDPSTGQICRTAHVITAKEAIKYPQAEPIAGTLLVRDVNNADDIAPHRARSRTRK